MDASIDRVRVQTTPDRSGTINFRKDVTSLRATGASEGIEYIIGLSSNTLSQ